MTEETKDLEYYMEHPHELPDDPEALARLAGQFDGDTSEDGEEQAETGEESEGAETVGAEPEEEQEEQSEEPDGDIETPSGNKIPYSVLKGERERNHELREQIRLLQEQVAKQNGEGTQTELPAVSEQELEALKEDFPELYKAHIEQQKALKTLEDRLNLLAKREQEREAEAIRKDQIAVQEAIDGNPFLSHWQAKDPETFAEAVKIDAAMRENPKYLALPLAKRFERVAKATAEIYGQPDIKVPNKPNPPPTPPKKPGNKPPVYSMSDLPSGSPPESSERQQAEEMSAAELGANLITMTEDQRRRYLATLL